MLPATLNISIYAGDTFTRSLAFADSNGDAIDITGWEWAAQIRRYRSAEVEESFTVTVTDAENGELSIALSPAKTAGLDAKEHVWDIQSTHNDIVRTYLAGKATVVRDVTRVG